MKRIELTNGFIRRRKIRDGNRFVTVGKVRVSKLVSEEAYSH